MDSIQFGAFVAQLRKESGLTQRELADRLHVTDKAVSKWETGKGFPDLKLLEPLAQALGVSLVELLQGERSPRENLTVAEADQLAAQAMEQSQKATARRYLKLLRWLLTGVALWCGLCLIPAFIILHDTLTLHTIEGISGGRDGPTAILVGTAQPMFPPWVYCLVLTAILLVCVVLAVRVRKVERRLK